VPASVTVPAMFELLLRCTIAPAASAEYPVYRATLTVSNHGTNTIPARLAAGVELVRYSIGGSRLARATRERVISVPSHGLDLAPGQSWTVQVDSLTYAPSAPPTSQAFSLVDQRRERSHANNGGSCRVPDHTQVLTANSFETLLWPVFQHPRCVGCHSFESSGKIDQGEHTMLHGRTGLTICHDCHVASVTGVQAWTTPVVASPNTDMDWGQKSLSATCRLMVANRSHFDFAIHFAQDSRIRWAIENRRTPDGVQQSAPPVSSAMEFAERYRRWKELGLLRCP